MRVGIRKHVKDLLGRAAGMAGMYCSGLRSRMTIVAFHRVSALLEQDGLTCEPDQFEEFCRFFQRHFTVLSLSEQLTALRTGRNVGGTISVTFDDGYRDNIEIAAPILRRLGLPATFFVTTGFIESEAIPYWDQHLPRQPGWMSWSDVRSLRDQGFEIGNHTVTHLDMGTATAEQMRDELAVSQRKLTDELGVAPRLFAFPFGGREQISALARDLVREAGFDCGVACHGGVNVARSDPFELNRIGIAEWFATPNQFGYELLIGKA
jgi:peptidoglycan/xylan/chitin deacetylase (PgdA/CDA1 family)